MLCLVAGALIASSLASAGAIVGGLDTSFGGDGRVAVPWFVSSVEPYRSGLLIARLPHFSDATFVHLVARSGAPVESFGVGGRSAVVAGRGWYTAVNAMIDSDGGFVLAASTGKGFAGDRDFRGGIIRLRRDGSYDPTFSQDGRAMFDIGLPLDRVDPTDIFTDADGNISMLVGVSLIKPGPRRYHLVRFTRDGRLRPGSPGGTPFIAVTPWLDTARFAFDGGFYLLRATSSTVRFGLTRYRPDGALDRRFGGDGTVVVGCGSGVAQVALRVDPRGRPVVICPPRYSSNRVIVARYTRKGALDPSFGGDGVATISMQVDAGEPGTVDQTTIDPFGRILLTGQTSLPGPMVVGRLTAAGLADPAFSNDGLSVVDLDGQLVPAGPTAATGERLYATLTVGAHGEVFAIDQE